MGWRAGWVSMSRSWRLTLGWRWSVSSRLGPSEMPGSWWGGLLLVSQAMADQQNTVCVENIFYIMFHHDILFPIFNVWICYDDKDDIMCEPKTRFVYLLDHWMSESWLCASQQIPETCRPAQGPEWGSLWQDPGMVEDNICNNSGVCRAIRRIFRDSWERVFWHLTFYYCRFE